MAGGGCCSVLDLLWLYGVAVSLLSLAVGFPWRNDADARGTQAVLHLPSNCWSCPNCQIFVGLERRLSF